MARLNHLPTPCFWNFIGLSCVIVSIGTSWTLIRGNAVEMELAQYKLRTGTALSKVQKANELAQENIEILPIASPQRQEAEQDLLKSNELLEQAQSQIDESEKQIIKTPVEP